MLMHTTCIDLFDHNVGMPWPKVRLRCSCIPPVCNFFFKFLAHTCQFFGVTGTPVSDFW